MNPLAATARVEEEAGRPLLRYASVPGGPDLEPVALHPLLAVVLARLAAGWSVEDLTRHLVDRLGNPEPETRELVEDAQICFKAHLARQNGERFVHLADPEGMLAGLAGADTTWSTREVVFPGDRALFPLTVQWLVTRFCNRRCVYCYAGATPGAQARDAAISRERILEILDEAHRLGAYNFFVTGGEPLLREESYDVLVHALELGMQPEIVSKQFIPDRQAARLAAAGLERIFLSIDSLDPAVAREVTGVRTFARDIERTVERLVAHGIAVYAKMVLTSRNVETVPLTLERLRELGVGWVGIETYAANLERHDELLAPSPEQLRRVLAWVKMTNQRHGDTFPVHFEPKVDESPPEGLGEDCIVCHNGITALLFLPDGRVSRCDKKLPGRELVVGDLRTQSVQEVWSSPQMIRSLKPPRSLYAGTPCHDCDYFDECHRRGRCYYDAYLTSGTLFGPQGNCPFIGETRHGPGC